ncbi:unnamed protein product [Adineta steineri]|uniref:Nudix hydrolase domain-containing protein n=1 Tax=Adineta steineri TaxID=433720 RepID=A0A814P7V8_9BILA|nr:unnamed protein product [Adineta steineri]CAF1104182.1 unnamed protein product [Adineta steineri]
MANQKDDVNDLNLNVMSKETTSLEILNHKNEEINDDNDKYAVEEVESDSNTKDLSNIEQLICAPDSENINQRIHAEEVSTDQYDALLHPPDGSTNLIDETNGTHTDSVDQYQCIKTRLPEDCHFPDSVFKLIRGQNQQEVINILLKVEEEKEKIWSGIDKKYTNIPITKRISSKMYREFKKAYNWYLSKEYSTQAKSVHDAQTILGNLSSGILILNKNNQILGVQNHYGTWSAPKGHPKIKDDGTLEIPLETILRELFEELFIEFEEDKTQITINKNNIDQHLDLNKDNFVGCGFNSRTDIDDGIRHIGLLAVRADEKKWKFSLKDNKENKDWAWLNIDDIIRHRPGNRHDKYHTLRPFAQYLKNNPMF